MSCKTCKFVHENWLHHGCEYQCRRHAPKVFQEQTGLRTHYEGEKLVREEHFLGPVTRWPVVKADDHCGEHEEKSGALGMTPEEIKREVAIGRFFAPQSPAASSDLKGEA